MGSAMNTSELWGMIHAERMRLAEVVEGLTDQQWGSYSLCTEWTVEQVVAHLTAAAHTGKAAWIRSIVRAGFHADKHNALLLKKYLGGSPRETLELFQRSIPLTTAPTKDLAAFLGEVVVHGQDIARPLGIGLVPNPDAVLQVAEFFVMKDFAVNSKSLVDGLRLEARDAPFASGKGPEVRGNLLDLVMVMAGRRDYLDALRGEGVGDGVAEGVGEGVGDGVAEGVGDGVGDGVAELRRRLGVM